LRVAAPIAFGSHSLAPAIVKFMKIYPDVTVDLTLSDRMVDLVEDGIDVAIRVGTLTDPTMMSRSLSPYKAVVCAAPAYLAERGTPAGAAIRLQDPVPPAAHRLAGEPQNDPETSRLPQFCRRGLRIGFPSAP